MNLPYILPPLLLLLLYYPPPTSTDWTSECESRYPASCRCTWSSGKRLADCQRANLNGLPILSSEIQILEFNNNHLEKLVDNAFTNANLINIQKLYLRSCRITKIHDLAFNNLRILIELDLSYNEIEFVDPNVFSTNVRLRVVKLNNNRVHTVREFPVLEHLNTIDLSENVISNFSYSTFTGLKNLKVLELTGNQFSNLNPATLPKLSSLGLRGNPWVCDCELKPLRDYVIANKFYEPELKCSEPLSLYNSQWDAFDELSCKPEILHILANGKIVDSIVALENTLVLSCVVRGDPLPDVKWVKNGRIVQEAMLSVNEIERTVMLNLTVGRNDNEFVCVGSNSGGVVERNLTVTVDEAGLSGFVVLKDGVDGGGNGMIGFRGERGGLIVYLVIGVVFLSLVVGLILGGVCVWRWKVASGVEGDSVVKGVIKDETTKVVDERGDMVVMTSGRGVGGGSVQGFAEQVPLLKQHTSADDLLDTDRYVNGRPTPDLITSSQQENEDVDNESLYAGKFPQPGGSSGGGDNTSIYDNYEVMYNKPLLSGADTLRRYAFLRSNDGRDGGQGVYGVGSLQRPSSVCSEPRGGFGGGSVRGFTPREGGTPVSGGGTVILPHGYVTLPRRSMRDRGKGGGSGVGGVIKYDNLGPRSTADGRSTASINKLGTDGNGLPPQHTLDPNLQHYSNLHELQEQDLYEQLNSLGLPQQQEYPMSPLKQINQFDPIPEVPGDEHEVQEETPVEEKKKYRPPPNPKPKKKPVTNETEQNGDVKHQQDDELVKGDDDGTEV